MFLYVSQVVGRLRGSLPQSELVERLKSLPKGLTKAYEANLKRVLDQDDDLDKRLTLRILLWIANTNRPLSRKSYWRPCLSVTAPKLSMGVTDMRQIENLLHSVLNLSCLIRRLLSSRSRVSSGVLTRITR